MYRENQNTCSETFFLESRAFYEITCKNKENSDRPQINIIRRMRFACWITKATDTHCEYVIRIAFPEQ